ncbi:MAG: flagellar M-ring protein FliF [Spirochaetales bacterium]|jgi:flagellar M-ring protein FliF|nr:flagellar M-ring protein FliF [Spirochaetales bacterium]
MNDFFKKYLGQIGAVWKKLSFVQRAVFVAVAVLALGGFGFLAAYSSTPSMTPLLYRAIPNEQELLRITQRLDQEGIRYQTTEDFRILVDDEKTAQRMRGVLTREDLIPGGSDPWQIFDVERWTITDFERNANLRRAITADLERHIAALDDIDAVSAIIGVPERELFSEDQKPWTASIRVTPKPGSDLVTNRKKREGIEKLVRFAIPYLMPDNITIVDHQGNVLNDFASTADGDRLELTRRELKAKLEYELRYRATILAALQKMYGADRVQVVNLNIDVDTSKKSVKDESHSPILVTPDNPRTPYDESAEEGAKVLSITTQEDIWDERFEGSGYHPQGPAGQEAQIPPGYKDLEDMFGKYSANKVGKTNVVNTTYTNEEKTPWVVTRVTAAVALDGVWKWRHDEKGAVILNTDGSIDREYIPVGDEDLAKAAALVRDAVGYSRDRGDSVTVQHIAFSRTEQFAQEDSDYRSRQQRNIIILSAVIALGALLVLFIAFRFISREMERRRRLREEELARQQQAMREAALRAAEQEGQEVEMSVEERTRMELTENVINMAREHPGDVAQLIRTWLREEG